MITRHLGGPSAPWPYKSREEIVVDLSSEPGFGLRVWLQCDLCSSGLLLLHPAFEEPVEVGYLDYAHGQSCTLRLEELDAVRQGVAPVAGCQQTHDTAYLLLSLFTTAPVPADTILRAGVERALANVGFDEAEILNLLAVADGERHFTPLEDLVWAPVAGGWVLEGRFRPSFRTREQPFPHAEFADVINRFEESAAGRSTRS